MPFSHSEMMDRDDTIDTTSFLARGSKPWASSQFQQEWHQESSRKNGHNIMGKTETECQLMLPTLSTPCNCYKFPLEW